MNTDDSARPSSWEAMLANLTADAVLADANLYAAGGRRITVEHGQPLTQQAIELLQQLVDQVDVATAGPGYLSGGAVTIRATSITWTLPSAQVPARELVLAARLAADQLNPGGWIITTDDYI